MKNIIVSLFFLFPLQELEWLKEERFILKSYQQYKLEMDNGDWRSLLDVAMELEKELIESKYLNSISKEDYMFFYKQYVFGNSPVNMVEIDKSNLFFSSLNYASTQARSWYIFDSAINETKNKNIENSSVFRIHALLEELFYQFRIGEVLFQKYLNTLSDEEFEKKEIYRVPILVFLYAELQQKQNEFVSVSVHSQQPSKKLLIGTWAACIEGGLYVELHFSEENEYAYHIDNELLNYNVGRYILCSEVVHIAIQEKGLDCKQLKDVHQMKMTFKSEDEFENDDQGEKIVFRRLSNKPLMDYRKGTVALEKEGYMEEFKFRKDTFNCFNSLQN